MKARDAALSGWPGERKTSCTIGGASMEDWLGAAAWPLLRCSTGPDSRIFLHSSHSPSGPAALPQALLRCSKPLCPDADAPAVILVRLDWRALINGNFSDSNRHCQRNSLASLLFWPSIVPLLKPGTSQRCGSVFWRNPDGKHRLEPGAALELPDKGFPSLASAAQACSRPKSCVASASIVFKQPANPDASHFCQNSCIRLHRFTRFQAICPG
jgi:hypothetical protein